MVFVLSGQCLDFGYSSMTKPFSDLINTNLFPLHSSEGWMASPEMHKLNPYGGFSTLKYHMNVAHNIDITKMSAFSALMRRS